MKKLCLINGSPRGDNSCSKYLLNFIKQQLDESTFNIQEINVIKAQRKNKIHEAYEELSNADSILMSLPLYVDNIPSHLLEFLVEYEKYCNEIIDEKNTKPRFYAIINNGFIEGTQNINAVNVLQNFAEKVDFNWRFAIGIGAGEFMRGSADFVKWKSRLKIDVYNKLVQLADDIESNDMQCVDNVYTNPAMLKILFMFVGAQHWYKAAKKNQLEKKQLYYKPY